ncbi:hypothetical protein JXB11_01135 [Candidatus Woesearchaeota archaeon]|nr:hypothetical protein [Candidatus Woesearchaeota archaeon]
MMQKKGEGLPIRMVIVAIIVLIVLVVVVFIFQKQMGVAEGDIGLQFTCIGRGGTCISGSESCDEETENKVCGMSCGDDEEEEGDLCCCIPKS